MQGASHLELSNKIARGRGGQKTVHEPFAGPSILVLAAAEDLFRSARHERRRSRTVIAIGDGMPSDPEASDTLAGITAANRDRIPINTIFLGTSKIARRFMRGCHSRTGDTAGI